MDFPTMELCRSEIRGKGELQNLYSSLCLGRINRHVMTQPTV